MRDKWLETVEAEERTALLEKMVKHGLSTGDVIKEVKRQRMTRRSDRDDDTGALLMRNKLRDSRREERTFRKEKNQLRMKLEETLSSNKFLRRVRRMKQIIGKSRSRIKKKNKARLERDLAKKKLEDKKRMIASLPEDCKPFSELKVLREEEITPEPPAPPMVASKNITLNEKEMKILSKSPKFALRNLLSKEDYMAEIEKGLIKEKYDRIGKVEENGKVAKDEDETKEEKEKEKSSEWMERKSELIYDLEENTIDFARSKPTQWKGNKRIHLPKAGSTSLEAYFEIRRQQASEIYDNCMKLLGEDCKTNHDNLDREEKEGLESLQKRVKTGELVIAQTDKSGKFCVLTKEQYMEAATVHIKDDRKLSLEESRMIENHLNGHMRWWAEMTCLSDNWNQRDRAVRNLLNHGLAVCPLTLLIKDHKIWSVESGESPPSRPVIGGNVGGNRAMSEYMSLYLEPVARGQNSMEINASGGLLSVIENINKDLKTRESSSQKEEEEVPTQMDVNQPSSGGPCHQYGGGAPQEQTNTRASGHTSLLENIQESSQQEANHEEIVQLTEYETDEEEFSSQVEEPSKLSTLQEEEPTTMPSSRPPLKRNEKMNYLRTRMTMVRKKNEANKQLNNARLQKTGLRRAKTQKGAAIIEANMRTLEDIQDQNDVVIVGSDVCALYPSLNDIEVAIICYQAILDSNINFQNFNYLVAGKYIAMHLTEEEQRRSPLYRVLPRRTTKNGVKPGVSSKPKNDENWMYPAEEMTELEERLIVATAVQIGVLTMMSTHRYSFNGDTYLQGSGGPIGLRATCAVARVVMNKWDEMWLERMTENNITVITGVRYMDDIRAFLHAIRAGWRMWEGRLCFSEEWRILDLKDGKSSTRRTAEILLSIMNQIIPSLQFTMEIGEDFIDLKLPTLDVKIWIVNGRIEYDFFEKPMSANIVLHAKTAQSDKNKFASLTQEVVRRLLHTSRTLPSSHRMENLERFCQKMANSGHKMSYIRNVTIAGIEKYTVKYKKSILPSNHVEYKPLHLGTNYNTHGRWKKKMQEAKNWYKDKEADQAGGKGKRMKVSQKAGKEKEKIETSSVVFVPPTRGGKLVEMLKDKAPLSSFSK